MPSVRPVSAKPAYPIRTLLLSLAAVAAILWLLSLLAHHTVLYPPGSYFIDLNVYTYRFTFFHTPEFFTYQATSVFAYPAAAAVLYRLFYATGNAQFTYFVLAALVVAISLAVTHFRFRTQGTAWLMPAFLLVAAFPFLFCVQRANIELILCVLTAAGLVLAWRGRLIPAASLFGVAAALKLYPILLLGLFLNRRRNLPAFAVGVLTAIALTLAAIAFTGPTFSFAAHGFLHGVSQFQDHYVDKVNFDEVYFDHSLLSPFKYIAAIRHLDLARWRIAYYATAGSLALILFLRVRTFPFLNRAVFLVAALLALPPVSFTYTLIHLYAPCLLLLPLLAKPSPAVPRGAIAAAALMLVLLLPLSALRVLGVEPTGPIAAIVLGLLLITPAFAPWPSPSAADAA
jgi:hypothetical protein